MCVWHDVIMQPFSKGRNEDLSARCGDRQCMPRGPGSDLPFCGIFEPVAFSNSSGAGIRGATVLCRWIAVLLIGAQSPEEGNWNGSLKLANDSRWWLTTPAVGAKAAAGFSLTNSLVDANYAV